MSVAVRFAAAALLVLAACAPKMIPNTNIEDTPDNRDILAVVQHYKDAMERKDAPAIAALASDRYLDARDNISKETLKGELEKDLAKVRDLQLEISVRRIVVDRDQAQADYFFSMNFLLDAADAAWQTESDDKRMNLVRENGAWKVINGF